MARNVYVLGDAGALTTILNVTCRRCSRRGRLHTAGLLREHGPDTLVPDLIRALVGECPRLRSTDIYDRCDTQCPDLSALFAGDAAKAQRSRLHTTARNLLASEVVG